MATPTSGVVTVSAPVALPLPASLHAPVAQLQTDLAAALQDGRGLVEQIPSGDVAAVNSDVLAVEQAAVALANASDFTIASPALDAYFNAAAIGVIIAEPKATNRILVVINPNFFSMAAQFLGDYERWQEITAASGLPADPQPIGQFTVTIPAS